MDRVPKPEVACLDARGRSRLGRRQALVALGGALALLLGSGEAGLGAAPSLDAGVIAKRVKASYAHVPGLTLDSRGHLEDGTALRVHQEVALKNGIIGQGLARLRGPYGGGVDLIWDAAGVTFSRTVGATCWGRDSSFGAAGQRVFDPALGPGTRARRRADGRIVFVGKERGDPTVWSWVIDPASYRLISQSVAHSKKPLPAETGRYRVRRGAPTLPVPTPAC